MLVPLYVIGAALGLYALVITFLAVASTAARSPRRRADARATLAVLWPPPLPARWTHPGRAPEQQPPARPQDAGRR